MKISSRMVGHRRAWSVRVGRVRVTVRRSGRILPYVERDSRTWWPFWGAVGGCGLVAVISTWSR